MSSAFRRDTRWVKLLRDLRLHPSRTIMVVLAMTVGLVGSGAVLDTWALMRQVTREEYRASHPASATLRIDSLRPELVQALRQRPELRAVQARRTVSGSIHREGDTESRALVLLALDDFANRDIGLIAPEHGQWPPSAHAIVIEHSSLEFAGLSEGDRVSVRVGDHEAVTLPVTGIARDVGLPPGWMEHVVYAFASPATLAELGAPSTFDQLQLAVRDESLDQRGVQRIAFDVQRWLTQQGQRVVNVDVPVPGEHQHAAQINSLLFTQGAFGVLALLCSGVLIVNLMAAMLVGQVREIGIMKTIGASPSQVAALYLAMAFVLGVVACVIAVPLAAVVGRGYADFTASILNFSTTGYSIPFAAFAVQIAVGLTFPVAAAAIPVMRGCRISVADALRDTGMSSSSSAGAAAQPSLLSRLAARGGVRRPLLFSLRNAFRRRQRMALTLTTLALGGAVYMGARNLKTAVRGTVDLTFRAQRYDLGLRLTRPASPDSIERVLRGVSGAAHAEAWGATRAAVDHGDRTLGNVFPISEVPVLTTAFEPSLSAGRWFTAADTLALVVNRRLRVTDSSLQVGARVTLVINDKPQSWTVIGVSESGTGPQAYAVRRAASPVDRAVIRSALPSPAAQLDLMQRVRTALADAGMPVQNGQLMSEARSAIEDHLVMVVDFLGIMGQLMIVVGGLALASTMGMAVLERTREIGVLRAVGAGHTSIFAMIQIEGLAITVLSWLAAIPLSVPMSVALGCAFGRIMLPVDVRYWPDAAGVWWWLAIAVVVSAVACALPARRAMRVPTKMALAYE